MKLWVVTYINIADQGHPLMALSLPSLSRVCHLLVDLKWESFVEVDITFLTGTDCFTVFCIGWISYTLLVHLLIITKHL